MPSRATRCSRVSFRSDHQRVRGVQLQFNRIGRIERVKRLDDHFDAAEGAARELHLEFKPDSNALDTRLYRQLKLPREIDRESAFGGDAT
jgi:hypothetical protein